MAQYRRESLSTSHRARIALLEEQLSQATNEKIQKMRQSQIATAEADYARRIQELEIDQYFAPQNELNQLRKEGLIVRTKRQACFLPATPY